MVSSRRLGACQSGGHLRATLPHADKFGQETLADYPTGNSGEFELGSETASRIGTCVTVTPR